MKRKLVLGAGFGDEGKGLVTDWLCRSSEQPLVVRFSGGQQAGHTVCSAGRCHVFSNFGSGTLQGAASYFSRFCTVDPVGMVRELRVLLAKGAQPLLHVDAQCPVTTPYDVCRNRQHHPHGSCGIGVGDTINRQEHHYSLTFADLFFPWVLDTRLELIRTFFYPQHADASLDEFLECCAKIVDSPHVRMVHGLPEDYGDHVYEGSQGLMLDQHCGFFPYVTRSSTGSTNAIALAGSRDMEVYLATRAYQTRHGDGPMSNEGLPHNIKANPRETNVRNAFQGELRLALLDLSLLAYAIEKDDLVRTATNRHLVVTCLDHVQDEHRFTWQGRIVQCASEEDFLGKIARTLGFASVYGSSSEDGTSIRHCQF